MQRICVTGEDVDWAFTAQDWYYSIELKPNTVTPGCFGAPSILSRRLLRHCELPGKRCLDIGPMEGLISAVLARRGAAHVTAIDITAAHKAKIDLVKSSLKFSMDFIAPLPLRNAPGHFRAAKTMAFDVVVCAGVLYHVLDVAAALGAVRAMVRPGGLVLVESWLSKGDTAVAYFNDRGRFTSEPNTYWFLTVGALDYLLRFYRLRPLDACYFDAPNQTLRLAVMCRAVEDPEIASGDSWISAAGTQSPDARAFIEATLPGSSCRVAYRGDNEGKCIDICGVVATQPSEKTEPRDATLWLSDEG